MSGVKNLPIAWFTMLRACTGLAVPRGETRSTPHHR